MPHVLTGTMEATQDRKERNEFLFGVGQCCELPGQGVFIKFFTLDGSAAQGAGTGKVPIALGHGLDLLQRELVLERERIGVTQTIADAQQG